MKERPIEFCGRYDVGGSMTTYTHEQAEELAENVSRDADNLKGIIISLLGRCCDYEQKIDELGRENERLRNDISDVIRR